MTTTHAFREELSFETRRARASSLKEKYGDSVPVVIGYDETQLQMSKNKFTIPRDLVIAQVMEVIRRRIGKDALTETEALYLFIDEPNGTLTLPASSASIGAVSRSSTHDDGFLYFKVSKENTFGGGGSGA